MTDAFDTRAREIACGEPLCFGDDETGHSSTCDMWVRSISSALREAVEAERRTIMNCLGYDERGDDIERTVEQDGVWIKVSSEAYLNLEGALDDLKRQNADRVCISTIERVQRQIGAALDHVRASAIRGESK